MSLLSAANGLHDFDAVSSLQGDGGMRAAWHDLHVDGHSGPLTVGNAKPFEQTADRTALWNGALFAINVDFDHKPNSGNKKSRSA
jgi:hypothetical protein